MKTINNECFFLLIFIILIIICIKSLNCTLQDSVLFSTLLTLIIYATLNKNYFEPFDDTNTKNNNSVQVQQTQTPQSQQNSQTPQTPQIPQPQMQISQPQQMQTIQSPQMQTSQPPRMQTIQQPQMQIQQPPQIQTIQQPQMQTIQQPQMQTIQQPRMLITQQPQIPLTQQQSQMPLNQHQQHQQQQQQHHQPPLILPYMQQGNMQVEIPAIPITTSYGAPYESGPQNNDYLKLIAKRAIESALQEIGKPYVQHMTNIDKTNDLNNINNINNIKLKYIKLLIDDLVKKQVLTSNTSTSDYFNKINNGIISIDETIIQLEGMALQSNNPELKYYDLNIDLVKPIGDKIANNWANDYNILNTSQWQVPVMRPPVCINNSPCAVCPSQSSNYPINLLQWNEARNVTG